MRESWIIGAAVLVLTAALVHAGPVPEEEQEGTGGWKTMHAIRQFFNPVTSYFQSIPSKTPSDIADDFRGTMGDVRDWASENDAVQALRGALTPVKNWISERADVVKDQTFSEMYESVKSSVSDLDERVGTWLQDKTSK